MQQNKFFARLNNFSCVEKHFSASLHEPALFIQELNLKAQVLVVILTSTTC